MSKEEAVQQASALTRVGAAVVLADFLWLKAGENRKGELAHWCMKSEQVLKIVRQKVVGRKKEG